MLEKITGPECPNCGCRDVITVPGGTYAGEKFICKHCSKRWRRRPPWPTPADVLPAVPGDLDADDDGGGGVPYGATACPNCGSTNQRITSTRRDAGGGSTRRYHVCNSCGRRFKSIERQ